MASTRCNTAASLLIDAGAHPKAIQRHLGHSSITTTLNTYEHFMPDEQDQVADDLDELRDNRSRPTAVHGPTSGTTTAVRPAPDLQEWEARPEGFEPPTF